MMRLAPLGTADRPCPAHWLRYWMVIVRKRLRKARWRGGFGLHLLGFLGLAAG